MSAFAAYTIIGLSLGGIFSLAALGIVLIYRTTGVLNLAHGTMGMFSTFVAWQVFYGWQHPGWPGWLKSPAPRGTPMGTPPWLKSTCPMRRTLSVRVSTSNAAASAPGEDGCPDGPPPGGGARQVLKMLIRASSVESDQWWQGPLAGWRKR